MNLKHLCMLVMPVVFWGTMQSVGRADEPAPQREPNVILDGSAALLNALVLRSVDRTEPVHETIQDTPVCGIGRTIGIVRADLIPDSRRAVVDVALQGTNYSQTVGARSTIRVFTYTTTPLEVRRRIVIDETGIRLYAGPSTAVSMTQLLDICSTMDMDYLAKCAARRIFENTRANAEAEGACKTIGHVVQSLDDELNPALATASASFGRALLSFRRAGLTLEEMRFSTTATNVQGRLHFATPGRKPPVAATLPSDVDLAVRVHESVATEAAQTEFGGRTFPLLGVSNIYDDLTRGLILDARSDADIQADLKKLAKLAADLAGKPVTVTLPKKDPLIVKFADQGFTLEGRVASVKHDQITYAGLRVNVTYRLSNRPDGVYATRIGGVKVTLDPADPDKKLVAMEPAVALVMEAMFTEFMKERIKLAALPMPAELASKLDPPRAYAGHGWFAIAWKLRKNP